MAATMFACAAVYFAIAMIVALAAGQLLRFVLDVGGLVFAGAAAIVLVERLRPRRPLTSGTVSMESGSDGTAAVAIPMSRLLGIALPTAFLGGAVFMVALAIVRMTDHPNDSVHPIRVVTSLFLIVVALTCLAMGMLMAAVSRVPRRLVMSENGIHQNNGSLDQYVPWSAIAAIVPTEADPTQGRSRRRIPMVLIEPNTASDITVLWRFRWFRQHTFLDVISVQPTAYPVNGGLLYYTLRFYWQHPELRHELGSDAAIERMRRGDVMG
ncbi:hypothetical protein [Nocardia sp. NBC_00511]|uniref:hypothetical protein n=1 Tax=Nocardia sp. NBC_00511 TaxID=2903591 RepID=UPI0030E01BFF